MEKKSRRTLLLKQKKPVRRGAASQVPPPRGIAEPPPPSEEVKKDHFAGRAQRWEAQWLDFLERVKSQEMLEEAAIWHEAKVLLDSFKPETEACWGPWNESAEEHEVETLAALPLELWNWLGERGLQTCAPVVALAKAFSRRQQESWKREKQGSCRTVKKRGANLECCWKEMKRRPFPVGKAQEDKREAPQRK